VFVTIQQSVTNCVCDNKAVCNKFYVSKITVACTKLRFSLSLCHTQTHTHTQTHKHTHTHTHSVTSTLFSLLYITFCSSQHTSPNLTVCHVLCTSTKCTNRCSDTPKLPTATETHNTQIFPLPQHNLQNINTVSEYGSALHGPHLINSIVFVLHLLTEVCVLIAKTGQWK